MKAKDLCLTITTAAACAVGASLFLDIDGDLPLQVLVGGSIGLSVIGPIVIASRSARRPGLVLWGIHGGATIIGGLLAFLTSLALTGWGLVGACVLIAATALIIQAVLAICAVLQLYRWRTLDGWNRFSLAFAIGYAFALGSWALFAWK